MNRKRAPLMRSLTAKWFFEMAGIRLQRSYLMTYLPSWKLTQKQTSSCCRVANVALASGDTFSKSGLVVSFPDPTNPSPVGRVWERDYYTGRSGTRTSRSTSASWLRLDGVSLPKISSAHLPGSVAAISWENFPSNVRNRTVHAISCA